MLERHRQYDWDFMKVNPRASSFVEDWGCRFQPSGDPLVAPRLLEYVIKSPKDWSAIQPLDPKGGVLGEQLQALALINKDLAGEAPFVQTVFSPLSIAGRLAGSQTQLVKRTMAENPQSLHKALAAITETFTAYSQACLETGASGIFFATTIWASRDLVSEAEYRQFGLPYDLQLLGAVQKASFNILHICGSNIFFDLLADYPVHAINWASTLSGNPSLREALSRTQKALIGGISEKTLLVEGSPQEVAAEAHRALEATGGRRFLLGPGCTIPPQAPAANLWAVRRSVEQP
jgi:uroporphyrinogen decarboxylase